MSPFAAQLQEFIRRLRIAEDEVHMISRRAIAVRQNLRDANTPRIRAKLARISGEVDGCASEGFPGATVAIYHHDTGAKLGELTCDADGLYEGRVGLDSNPQDVDIVATPTGTYAARFAGPVVTPATVSVGANAISPIVIPPTVDWCCGEVDYFPGECDFAWTFNIKGCAGTALAGATIELRQAGVLIDSCVTADGTGGTTLGRCVLTVPGGTYDVTITGPIGAGFAASVSSQSISGAKTTDTLLATDADHDCWDCSNYPIPHELHSTDSDGPFTLALSYVLGNPRYTVNSTTEVAEACEQGGFGTCINCVSPATIRKDYRISLTSSCTASLFIGTDTVDCPGGICKHGLPEGSTGGYIIGTIPVDASNNNPLNLVFSVPTVIPGTATCGPLAMPGGGGTMAFTA